MFKFDEVTAVNHAAELLGAHLNQIRRFDSPHLVLRCTVQGQNDFLPKSVIIKQLPMSEESGHKAKALELFRNEWVCLQFLTDIATDRPLAPRLLTSDDTVRMIILEDLGDCPTVQDSLFNADRKISEQTLVRYAAYLAELHTSTLGKEPEFVAIQSNIGTTSPPSDSTVDIREQVKNFRDNFAIIGLSVEESFYDEIHIVEEIIHATNNPFRTFIHADCGPHNILHNNDRISLIDFEFGTYGHALLDLVSARLGFPHAFRGMQTPRPIINAMDTIYRQQFGRIATNDDIFYKNLTYACTHWAYSRLVGLLKMLVSYKTDGEAETLESFGEMTQAVTNLLGQETTYIAHWSQRGRLTILDNVLHLLEQHHYLPSLQSVIKKLRQLMIARFQTKVLPLYPAFR